MEGVRVQQSERQMMQVQVREQEQVVGREMVCERRWWRRDGGQSYGVLRKYTMAVIRRHTEIYDGGHQASYGNIRWRSYGVAAFRRTFKIAFRRTMGLMRANAVPLS